MSEKMSEFDSGCFFCLFVIVLFVIGFLVGFFTRGAITITPS